MRTDILHIGHYPPPTGGIAVHVERLAARCRAEGLAVEVIDPHGVYQAETGTTPAGVIRLRGSAAGRSAELCRRVARSPARVVHLHASAMEKFLLLSDFFLAALGSRRLVLTLHSGRFPAVLPQTGVAAWIYRRALRRVLARVDHLIAVNLEQAAHLVEHWSFPPERISVIPAFIPQTAGALEPALEARLADLASGGRRLVLLSGPVKRLYRFEDALAAVRRLPDPDRVGTVLCLYTPVDDDYLREISAAAEGLPHLVLPPLSAPEFLGVMERSDVYLRCTDQDGDSVAVREALASGRAVIASDAVQRPEGCRVYPVGSVEALAAALEVALGEGAARGEGAGPPVGEDPWPRIRPLYALPARTEAA